MRAIDGDALKDRINRMIEVNHLDEYAVWFTPDNVKMLIEDAPTIEPETHWIPCSERLPEERQEILATTTDNAWGDVMIIRTYYKEMHKSVIAWMPLPKPYREEGD